jgi:uncharacterized protein YaaR (DUF327 family)
MMKKFILLSLLSLLSACTTSSQSSSNSAPPQKVSERVIDAVTLCSSGSSLSISTETTLINELTKILEKQGTANNSAQIEYTIKEIAFGGKNLSNSNTIESQRIYSKCVLETLSRL